MTLYEILNSNGRKFEDITQIYRGKDHYCRCGCGGKYFKPGERGFKRAVTQMNKSDFTPLAVEAPAGYRFINISYDNSTREGKCFCLYFG